MILFTKPDCVKCYQIKEQIDLEALGVEVHELTAEDSDALGLLAFYEGVMQAEEVGLPILILDDETKVVDFGEIARALGAEIIPHETECGEECTI